MKRIWIWLCLALFVMTLSATAQQPPPQQSAPQEPPAPPSLADAARALRNQQRPHAKVVYDNDNLPKSGIINVMGEASAPAEAAKDDKGAAADAGPPADDSKTKLADQQKVVADLQKEIDTMQSEHTKKLTTTDRGTRIAFGNKWEEDEKKYAADLADKQKKLEDAKQQLSTLEAQATKGPTS